MFLRELVNLNNEMDRIFEPCTRAASTPLINLYEKEGKIVLKAELPNVDKKDIKIEVKDNVIDISGKKKDEKISDNDNYYQREFSSESFERVVKLPIKVNSETVKAQLEDGILTIELEQNEKEKPRLISIQ